MMVISAWVFILGENIIHWQKFPNGLSCQRRGKTVGASSSCYVWPTARSQSGWVMVVMVKSRRRALVQKLFPDPRHWHGFLFVWQTATQQRSWHKYKVWSLVQVKHVQYARTKLWQEYHLGILRVGQSGGGSVRTYIDLHVQLGV